MLNREDWATLPKVNSPETGFVASSRFGGLALMVRNYIPHDIDFDKSKMRYPGHRLYWGKTTWGRKTYSLDVPQWELEESPSPFDIPLVFSLTRAARTRGITLLEAAQMQTQIVMIHGARVLTEVIYDDDFLITYDLFTNLWGPVYLHDTIEFIPYVEFYSHDDRLVFSNYLE